MATEEPASICRVRRHPDGVERPAEFRQFQMKTIFIFDRFDLRYYNNRNNDSLEQVDNLVSPRAGIVVKPLPTMSLYTSYSVSYLPSSGDQFSSLTTVTQP